LTPPPDAYLEPHLDRAALITIDVQCDTLDGQPVEIPGTSAALPAIVATTEMFRAAGRPIVHMVRLYRRDGSNVDLCRRASVESGRSLFLAGSSGAEPAPGLLPDPSTRLDPELLLRGDPQPVGGDEFVFYKPRWGAFFQTSLEVHLRRRAVDTLVVCGCNFPNCPRTSIYEASERDYRVVVVGDALSGLGAQGIDELDGIGVSVVALAELRAGLAATPATPA
jgi:nicotinamidase-related amidase